jgi:hypothetical protein
LPERRPPFTGKERREPSAAMGMQPWKSRLPLKILYRLPLE